MEKVTLKDSKESEPKVSGKPENESIETNISATKVAELREKTILSCYPEHLVIGLSLGLIVCVCGFSYGIFCLCSVLFPTGKPTPPLEQVNTSVTGNSLNQSEANATSVERVKPKPKVIIIRQPTCNELQHFDHVLEEVQQSLYHKYELCYPADIHNPLKHLVPSKGTPSDAIADSRGYFVVYIAVSLLLASLAAAVIDLCKAKGQRPSKNKPPLTKRCSLADLTVLRHSRRESMRGDSLVDEHRGPLKLLGSHQLGYERRFSSPINSGSSSHEIFGCRFSPRAPRKLSLDHYRYDEDLYAHEFHRVRLIRRY